jgi:hypothetical protein
MNTNKLKGRIVPQPIPRLDPTVVVQHTIPAEFAAVDLAIWYAMQAPAWGPESRPDLSANTILALKVGLLITRVAEHPAQVSYVLAVIATQKILGSIVIAAGLGETHLGLLVGDVPNAREALTDLLDNLRPALAHANELLDQRPVPWAQIVEEA